MKRRKTLGLLTEGRGIAALMIVHLHLFIWHLPLFYSSTLVQRILAPAYLAVDFFFILSGFVLAHVYRGKLLNGAKGGKLRDFLRARFARIYPLHILASVGFLIISGLLNGSWDWKHFRNDVLLINSLPGIYPLNVPSWSISAECLTYLLAPGFIFAAPRGRSWVLALSTIAAACGLAYLSIFRWGTLDYHSVFRCIPEFLYGVICYEFCARRPWRCRNATVVCALSLAAMGCVYPLLWGSFAIVGGLLFVAILGPLISAASQLPPALVVRATSRSLQFLGDISYSVYLIHPLLLLCIPLVKAALNRRGIGEFAAESLVYPLTLGLLITLSFATYRLVEIPFRVFLRSGLHHTQDLLPATGTIDRRQD